MIRSFLLFFLLLLPSIPSSAQWIEANGQGGGSITSFALLGSDVFAATDKGVIRSTDNGLTWNLASSGITNLYVQALATSNSTIFAGTAAGVFRSIDSGSTWSFDNTGMSGTSVTAMAANDTVIYAASGFEVYRSTDNGSNWYVTSQAAPNTDAITSIAIAGSSVIVGTQSKGVFRTDNDGASWYSASIGIFDPGINALAVSGNDVYAATFSGVFHSDNKYTWTLDTADMIVPYVISIAANSTTVFAGTTWAGLYRQNVGDSHWTLIGNGLSGQGIYALFANETLVLAHDGIADLARSTDNGSSWSSVNAGVERVYNPQITGDSTNLFLASDGAGAYRSTDNGRHWKSIAAALGTDSIPAILLDGSTLYAGTDGHGAFISTDYGTTWTPIGNGLTSRNITSITKGGSNLFAWTYGGMYLSGDNGANWNFTAPSLIGSINGFSVNGADLYVSFLDGIYRSSDNGSHWKSVLGNLPKGDIFSVAAIDTTLFTIVNTDSERLYHSTDLGKHWSLFDAAVVRPISLLVDEHTLYVGTAQGLFYTTDDGVTWSRMDSTDTSRDYMRLYQNQFTLYGYSSNGIWRHSILGTVSAVRTANVLPNDLSVYPNPVSDRATISFSVSSSGRATISIVNLLGIPIANLYSGEVSAGDHSLLWEPTGLQKGTYECVMRIDGDVETVPLIVAH